ncbi:MAG: DUF3302 domain-containing protein [Rhizobiaceae bacterium]
MSGLDIFAWIVLIVLILAVLAGFIVLAMLPGKIAKQRNHPQSEAINVAGWVGALLAGIFWPLALIWAFTKYPGMEDSRPSKDRSSEGQEAQT